MKASHFLVRQESGKEAPGPSVPLKNTNSNANNWRICVFLTRHSDGPGTPTANEVAFSVARETARMTFARSHAARVPENGIWNRAANLAPAVAGEIISAQRPFRTHAVRNAGLCAGLKPHRARRDSQYHFSTHPKDASTRMSFLLFRVRSKNATASPFCARRRVPRPTERKPGSWAAGWVPGPSE